MAIKTYLNTYPKIRKIKTTDWFIREKNYLNYEKQLVDNLTNHLNKKYNIQISSNDLHHFLKFTYLYEQNFPFELKILSWPIIKRLLDIYDNEKRKFYINLCYQKNLSLKKLNEYLSIDLYEKYLFGIQKYLDANVSLNDLAKEKFIDKIIIIEKIII